MSDEDLAALRNFAEQLTRRYETEIVWPAWIKSIKTKSMPVAEEAFRNGNYDKARETIWRAAATGVKPVDEGVREFGIEFLNTQVNPTQWRAIEKEMCEKVLAFEKAGKYKEAIAWLKTVPYVREYSTILDARLAKVKEELIKLSVPADEIQPIFDATTALLDKVECIYDYTDTTERDSAASAAEIELTAYYKAVSNFKKTLVRYNCTEANAAKLTQDLTTAASKLLEHLYTTTTTTTGSLKLGTGAINKRIDARREAMIMRLEHALNSSLRDAKLDALFAANDMDGIRALQKAEMEAVLLEQFNTTEVIVPGKEIVSPLDLAIVGEQLRYEVRTAVRAKEYSKARELIWASIFPTTQTIRSEYLRPIGTKLLLTTVNATHWADIEADINAIATADTDPKVALKKLTNYPRIKTYATEIDQRLEAAANTATGLGSKHTAGQIEAIKAATAEMKNLVNNTDKTSSEIIRTGKPVDRTILDQLLADYRATLIKNDCTPENADKLIQMFNDIVKADFNAIAQDQTSDVLHLGCNALNARIDKLTNAKIAEINAKLAAEKAEAEAKLAAEKAFEEHVLDFCKRVCDATVAKDFEVARNLVRDEPLTGNAEQDAKMYIVRVGMLNSVINPAQYNALCEEIKQKVDAYVKANDFEALQQYIETYPYVKDEYATINEMLEALKGTIVNLPVAEADAATYVTDLNTRITQLLDMRAGTYAAQLDMKEVEQALDALASAVTEHYYPLVKATFTEQCKQEILALGTKHASMTTAELNQKIKLSLLPLLAKAKIEISKAKYLARLAEIDAEVSADTQITLAEEAIRRQLGSTCCTLSYKVNALLGEYARVFRDLKRQKEMTATQTAVMLLGAAYLDQDVVVERALELGADINATSERDPLARTALMIALEAQNTKLVKTLVEKGADLTTTDAEGNGIMHYAVRSGSITAVKALAEGAPVTVANKAGATPLFIAAARNQVAMVEAVLACVEEDARAAFVNTADAAGQTAFRVAVTLSSRDVLDALANAGATFDSADLRIAAERDYLAIAQWLIDHSVDVNADGVMASACPAKATSRYLVKEGGITRHQPCNTCKPKTEEKVEAPAPKAQPTIVTIAVSDAAKIACPAVATAPVTAPEVKTQE